MFAHTEERERERQSRRRTQFNYPHIFQLPKYTKLLNSAWQTSSKFWSPRVVYTLKSMGATTTTSWPVPKTQMRKCSRRRQGRAGQEEEENGGVADGVWQVANGANDKWGASVPSSFGYIQLFRVFGSWRGCCHATWPTWLAGGHSTRPGDSFAL